MDCKFKKEENLIWLQRKTKPILNEIFINIKSIIRSGEMPWNRENLSQYQNRKIFVIIIMKTNSKKEFLLHKTSEILRHR